MATWVPVPEGSDFPIENLPFGIVRPRRELPRPAVRIGDHVVDLATLSRAGLLDVPAAAVLHHSALNPLMAAGLGPPIRRQVAALLSSTPEPGVEDALLPLDEVEVLLPIMVGDYVDFYSSLHHAQNLGRMFRPDAEPLLPNWRHLPVAYHGRSGTVRVSGADVVRPEGLVPDGAGVPRLVPSGALDIELEVGFVVGTRRHPDPAGRRRRPRVRRRAPQRLVGPGHPGLRVPAARARTSARASPRRSRRGSSRSTRCARTSSPVRSRTRRPTRTCRCQRPWALDLHLEVELNGERISATGFRSMYWTFAQQLAHMTVNGATTRTGDLFGSGTVSGPSRSERGSFIELTWRGAEPLTLTDGSTRTFLLDGDTVTFRGWCRRRRSRSPAHRLRRGPRHRLACPGPLSALRWRP